jgi:lysophospholipase L1-like esterase
MTEYEGIPSHLTPQALAAAIEGGIAPLGYAPVKRVTFPLAGTESTQTAAAFDRGYRMPVRLAVTTTRWRLRVGNRNLLSNANLTTPLTSGGLYFGDPAYDTSGNWNANFTAVPVKVLDAFAVPTDGTDYTSPWVDDPAQQFTAHKPRMLSWNLVSAGATGTGVCVSNARQSFYQSANGGSLASAKTASGGFFPATVNGDVRIEFEFAGAQPVGLAVGDSITHGRGDGDVTGTRKATLPHQSWPCLGGEQAGAVVANLAVSSATTGNFTAANMLTYTRADLATTVPDFALIAIGANELGADMSMVETNIMTLIDVLRGLGIPKVYLCTVTPRSDIANQRGTLSAAAASGATTLSSSVNTGATSITVGVGVGQETLTVSSVTGSGPYTLTLAAATTKAHAVGDQVIYSSEKSRQTLNDWIRQVPYNIDGVIDFDSVMAAPIGSASPDMRFMSADGLHPLRAGYQRMAQLAAAVLSR